MIARSRFDFVFVSGEYHDDHPLSAVGVITRWLDSLGYSVGIIELPKSSNDVMKLGRPALAFLVSSGCVDSMLRNYTPLKKKRQSGVPDRAVIRYCNWIREACKDTTVVIGGIEASLRRFSHYDYWDNDVRGSILLDAKADILVYGNGELQIAEIAKRLAAGGSLDGIDGTMVAMRTPPKGSVALPRAEDVKVDPAAFCAMQRSLSNHTLLSQQHGLRHVVQYPYPAYTPETLDSIYGLPFTRKLHPGSELGMASFSVVTHRGCIGGCSFCSIALHQGDRIISRSERSILEEIRRMTSLPGFKGVVDDLGGPSANMYGMDCNACNNRCISCARLERSHARLVRLMRQARAIPGVRKVLVRSGIRYDLAIESEGYMRELLHHVPGTLKIAPEHFSIRVLKRMGKSNASFERFRQRFGELDATRKLGLRYYFMIGHPGDNEQELAAILPKLRSLCNIEQFQLFTPTPMSVSSCMYWTGIDPRDGSKVTTVHDYATKKRMKRMMLNLIENADDTSMKGTWKDCYGGDDVKRRRNSVKRS